MLSRVVLRVSRWRDKQERMKRKLQIKIEREKLLLGQEICSRKNLVVPALGRDRFPQRLLSSKFSQTRPHGFSCETTLPDRRPVVFCGNLPILNST
jgi:hypothetical protein